MEDEHQHDWMEVCSFQYSWAVCRCGAEMRGCISGLHHEMKGAELEAARSALVSQGKADFERLMER